MTARKPAARTCSCRFYEERGDYRCHHCGLPPAERRPGPANPARHADAALAAIDAVLKEMS